MAKKSGKMAGARVKKGKLFVSGDITVQDKTGKLEAVDGVIVEDDGEATVGGKITTISGIQPTGNLKFTLFIDAPLDLFSSWLTQFTMNAPYTPFPTEKGYICLQSIRTYAPHHMSMEGIYCTDGKNENCQKAIPIPNIIRFKVTPLTSDRTEITAECTQPVIEEYFLRMIDEINKRWPQSPDVEAHLNEIKQSIKTGVTDLQRGQRALYNMSRSNQESLKQIQDLIKSGHLDQGEMERTLDAIRRALKLMQTTNISVNETTQEQLEKARRIVESTMTVQHKLEATLPIVPFLLEYKIELSTESELDIEAAISEIKEHWESIIRRASKPN